MAQPLSPLTMGSPKLNSSMPYFNHSSSNKASRPQTPNPADIPLPETIDRTGAVAYLSNSSSPFDTVTDSQMDQENRPPSYEQQPSPLKAHSNRSPSKQKNSPLFAPSTHMNTFEIYDEEAVKSRSQTPSSAFKHSPRKSSPLKPIVSAKRERTDQSNDETTGVLRDSTTEISHTPSAITRTLHLDDLFSNAQAVDTDQDMTSSGSLHEEEAEEPDIDEVGDKTTLSDDTCFSAFSAIPNADMTLFAKLASHSPDKTQDITQTLGQTFATPATSRKPARRDSSRSPSPTPRGKQRNSDDTTSLLLDFTQQHFPSYRANNSPTKLQPSSTEPNLLSHLNNLRNQSPSKNVSATPSRRRQSNLLNLLDFDLPPQPTPRSIPTITVRELETLKSNYLSEISSLKASLSGREAEVDSLKRAINDAERRVGEAQEQLREERNAREHAEKEKGQWEKKGTEVEGVLKQVREEFFEIEKEKEELIQKLEEANKLREEAEIKAVEAESRAATESKATVDGKPSESPAVDDLVAKQVAAQLDNKMETLARDLHSVYKQKHESKVATLKKTYEARAEKKCKELQARIEDLTKQNEDLQTAKDATFSGELPAQHHVENREEVEKLKTEAREQEAQIAGLVREIASIRSSHDTAMKELEQERVEKGELVAAVDEMLALQADQSVVGGPAADTTASNTVEAFRKSIGKPSGLAKPTSARPGGLPALSRSVSGGLAPKSRMMSNIERMGGKA